MDCAVSARSRVDVLDVSARGPLLALEEDTVQVSHDWLVIGFNQIMRLSRWYIRATSLRLPRVHVIPMARLPLSHKVLSTGFGISIIHRSNPLPSASPTILFLLTARPPHFVYFATFGSLPASQQTRFPSFHAR